jgi:hypothetical protein
MFWLVGQRIWRSICSYVVRYFGLRTRAAGAYTEVVLEAADRIIVDDSLASLESKVQGWCRDDLRLSSRGRQSSRRDDGGRHVQNKSARWRALIQRQGPMRKRPLTSAGELSPSAASRSGP